MFSRCADRDWRQSSTPRAVGAALWRRSPSMPVSYEYKGEGNMQFAIGGVGVIGGSGCGPLSDGCGSGGQRAHQCFCEQVFRLVRSFVQPSPSPLPAALSIVPSRFRSSMAGPTLPPLAWCDLLLHRCCSPLFRSLSSCFKKSRSTCSHLGGYVTTGCWPVETSAKGTSWLRQIRNRSPPPARAAKDG